MRQRRRVKTRLIALLTFFTFVLSVSAHFIDGTSILAQGSVDSSVRRTIDYLVESSKNLSVNFDDVSQTQPQILVNGRRLLSDQKNKSFDLSDLGKLVFRSQYSVSIPEKIGLSGNEAAGNASFSLQHELEGVTIPPHLQAQFRGEASDSNFVSQQGKLATLELTLEGLLFKGVPEYLSKSNLMKELVKKYDFKLETQGDDKAILSKTIALSPQQKELFDKLSEVQAELSKTQQQIQQLSSLDNARSSQGARCNPFGCSQSIVAECNPFGCPQAPLGQACTALGCPTSPRIDDLKNDLKKYALEKSNLLSQAFRDLQFPCAPEFEREVKFPIFERSVSTSSSNASGRAAVGVSGDVKMEVKNPTCGISMISPFKFEAWTYADIDITSRGFFGARAEGQASKDFGITFSDKSGSYQVSLEISPEEKQAFNGLALKMFDKAKNDQQILRSLQEQIDSKAVEISTSIQRELIGDGTDISRICSLFDKLGLRTPNSEEDLICWAFNTTSLRPKPELKKIPLNLLPKPQLPTRPNGTCKVDLPLPNCLRTQRVCGIPSVCNRERCLLGGCTTVQEPCTICENREIETRPNCRADRLAIQAANATNKKICTDIQRWDSVVKRIEGDWNAQNQRIRDQWQRDTDLATQEFNRKLAEWTELSDRWSKYRNPAVVLAAANRVVNERILRPLDSVATSTIAQHLLDAAWQGVDWIDMTNDFVRTNLPGDLSINVQGSARASLTSRAHLLHARPKFKTSATLEISSEGQPTLNLAFSGFQNAREDGSGGIGGLDVLGYTLTAEQKISVGGEKIQQPEYKIKPEGFTPTFDKGKIPLSNKEEVFYQKSYRYGRGFLVSGK